METISIITIISIAFLGSFGHCVGMCGGIVIAYSSTKIKNEWTKKIQALTHLLYSFGRISTYMILGALFGLVGGVVTFDNYPFAEYMDPPLTVVDIDTYKLGEMAAEVLINKIKDQNFIQRENLISIELIPRLSTRKV